MPTDFFNISIQITIKYICLLSIFISEYLTWGNLSYKRYPAASYGAADSQCKSDGSFLAIPRSEAENDFFASLLPNEDIWIGINDIEQEGSFVGVDGSNISYTNWYGGQPNGGTGQNGVEIWNTESIGVWNDREVSDPNMFICSNYIEGIIFRFELYRQCLSQQRPEFKFSFLKII